VSRERKRSRAAELSADPDPDVDPDPIGLWSNSEVVVEAPSVDPDAIDDLSFDDPAHEQKEDRAPISTPVSHTFALSTYHSFSLNHYPHCPPPRNRIPALEIRLACYTPIPRGAHVLRSTRLPLAKHAKTLSSSIP
jgi:hypothetical protein